MRQNSKPQAIDTNLLIKSVVTDMFNAEKGGHWLLSSYTPFKDKPCFPGFENRSFEEVRYGYYEAMKNGTAEQYKQQLQIALQEAAMKMKALQNPTSEIISMLIQIYNAPVSNQNNQTFISPQTNTVYNQNQTQSGSIFAIANQQLFGKSSSPQQSIFGGTATNTNIYGGVPQQNVNQNLFSNNQSMFNNQQAFTNTSNKSVFGNQNFAANSSPNYQSTPFTAQNNIFTQPNNTFNTNVFNSQAQTSSFFQAQPISNSPLSNKAQSENNPIFSPQSQPFSNTNTVPATISSLPFGGQVQQSAYTSNIGQNANTIPVQMQQTQQSSQSSDTGNTIFAMPTPNSNMFVQQPSIFNNQSGGTEQKLTNSVFAQNAPPLGNVFGGNAEITDSSAYSRLEDP